jgi:hypothetical protein
LAAFLTGFFATAFLGVAFFDVAISMVLRISTVFYSAVKSDDELASVGL